jgi:hypothetical protein
MIDEDRRYFWRAEWGLTDEDREIIRTRGIPTVDQERCLRIATQIDTRGDVAKLALDRRGWRQRRKNFGTVQLL